MPDVHPRPRKRPPRCTLDCGFKTSESPALRGFVGGLRALATAALYLVLKSNGFHCPEIRLKKFGFSPKSVPANIAKKLPSQLCPKPFLIAFFNFSHKRPTFAFTGESGYTLAFANRIAHSGLHAETGVFSPSATTGLCVASEVATERTAGRSGCTPVACVRFFRRRGPAGLRDLFSFLSKLRLVCPALRAFPCVRGEGWYHYPQRALRAAETPDGRLSKRLICRFLRSGGRSSPHDSYFLANTQNFLLAVPVANAFALWYDKFSKLEVAYFFITKDLLSIARIVASIPSRWSYSCCMSSDISSSIRISCFSQFSSV